MHTPIKGEVTFCWETLKNLNKIKGKYKSQSSSICYTFTPYFLHFTTIIVLKKWPRPLMIFVDTISWHLVKCMYRLVSITTYHPSFFCVIAAIFLCNLLVSLTALIRGQHCYNNVCYFLSETSQYAINKINTYENVYLAPCMATFKTHTPTESKNKKSSRNAKWLWCSRNLWIF